MKKRFLVIFFALLFISCSDSLQDNEKTENEIDKKDNDEVVSTYETNFNKFDDFCNGKVYDDIFLKEYELTFELSETTYGYGVIFELSDPEDRDYNKQEIHTIHKMQYSEWVTDEINTPHSRDEYKIPEIWNAVCIFDKYNLYYFINEFRSKWHGDLMNGNFEGYRFNVEYKKFGDIELPYRMTVYFHLLNGETTSEYYKRYEILDFKFIEN